MTWYDDTIADIRSDEACRLIAYQDGGGVWTLGYGHTAGVKPGDTCTMDQAKTWLYYDVGVAENDLNVHATWWTLAPDSVRRGLLNMCFNLGWPRLSGFVRLLAAGAVQDYATMAYEAETSLWASQVGARASRIVALFRAGAQLELPV